MEGILTPRERSIIEMRFGLLDGVAHTLGEVGQEFGVTGQRIRDLEAKSLGKMQSKLKENGIINLSELL